MRWLALACGLFAAGAFGLYLLVAGHRADLSRMPDEAPARPAVSTEAGPAPQSSPPADPVAAPPAGGVPPTDATAGPVSTDPLAAAVERLRAGLPATPPQPAPDGTAAAGAQGTPADQAGDAASSAAAQDDPGPLDNPAVSSSEAAGPPAGAEPPVRPGRHVTALGVRWALSVAGGRPSLVVQLGDGGEAHVQVAPEFLALNIHAMSRNVENVRFLILHDYLGRPGDYLFTPDGKLARL
jgi:hypothetical protein